MNPQDYNSQALAEALGLIGQGIQTQAMRPQKTSQTTVSTTKPVEYADMLARRNQIGAERQALADVLKKRENFGYSLASALSALPQQQGYGSWLSDLGRSFGAGFNARTNAEIDRAQQDYEAAQKDLANALAFDNAMGDIQTQTQTINYTPMEYGSGKQGPDTGMGVGSKLIASGFGGTKLDKLNKGAGRFETNRYDPSNPEQGILTRIGTQLLPGKDYGVARSQGKREAQDFEKFQTVAMESAFDVLKYLRPATDTDVLVALRKVGADPTMTPEARDKAVTSELNKELVKSGISPVSNLKEWDNLVEKISKNIGVSGIPEDLTTKITMPVDLNSIKSGQNSIMPGDVITFSDGSTLTFKGDGSESDKEILEALQ